MAVQSIKSTARVSPCGALVLLWAALIVLAGCSKPKLPEHDNPPEPVAAPPDVTATPSHTELHDAIQQPIDRTNAAKDAAEAASRAQDEQIEAAAGR